jgi:hypothetical protein
MSIMIYLDDLRPTPEGWVRCYWPEEVIKLLKTKDVSRISLDHDLGEEGYDARSGRDVLTWIMEQVVTDPNFIPPKIMIHTDNASAMESMKLTARRICELYEERKNK